MTPATSHVASLNFVVCQKGTYIYRIAHLMVRKRGLSRQVVSGVNQHIETSNGA